MIIEACCVISGIPGRITIGGIPKSIIFFNSVKEEWIILHDKPCLSADSIPSIRILPSNPEYFFVVCCVWSLFDKHLISGLQIELESFKDGYLQDLFPGD